MTTKVKIKDRNKEVNYLKMALNMVGFAVTYEGADLIHKAVNMVKEKQGDMCLKDIATLQSEWEKKWDSYFDQIKPDDNITYNERANSYDEIIKFASDLTGHDEVTIKQMYNDWLK